MLTTSDKPSMNISSCHTAIPVLSHDLFTGSVSEGDGIPKVIPKLIRSPPLPCFNENTDSIYAYLQCYKRYAENQGWEEDNYAVFLSALLTGHALEVYSVLRHRLRIITPR